MRLSNLWTRFHPVRWVVLLGVLGNFVWLATSGAEAPAATGDQGNAGAAAISDPESSPSEPETGTEGTESDVLRALTKEAYIFAYPLVQNYGTLVTYAVDQSSPDYRGPFNTFVPMGRPYVPQDLVPAPSNDTIPAFAWLDLRAEPVVLTVPAVGTERYFSLTLVDLFTHNFAVMGTRTIGAKGGNFLVVGPNWKGKIPGGITRTFRSESEFAFAVLRMQLFGPGDFENLRTLQAQFTIRPLSNYLKRKAPQRPAPAAFPRFSQSYAQGPGFITYLNFVLQYSQRHPKDAPLLKRLEKLGVGAGEPFDPEDLPPETLISMQAGIEDAEAELAAAIPQVRTLYKLYGNRDVFEGNHFNRALGAKLGLYAGDWEEVLYLPIGRDTLGRPLNGKDGVYYLLRFPPGQLPPARAFWSLTLYQGGSMSFFPNPYDRQALSSAIKPDFVKDEDGGLTLYIGEYSPGPGLDVNWLPAPAGPFVLTLRLYWPEASALEGRWKVPLPKRMLPNIPDLPFDPPFVSATPTPTPKSQVPERNGAPFVKEAQGLPLTTPSPAASPDLEATPTPLPTIQVPKLGPPMLDDELLLEGNPTPMPVRKAESAGPETPAE